MSKVKKITRSLDIQSATWFAGVLTIVTTSPHYVETGDLVSIFAGHGPWELINTAVTLIDATSFSVATPEAYSFLNGNIVVDFFRTGQTGRYTFTMPRGAGVSAVVQTVATGTGGAVVGLDASLDGVHWIILTSLTHTAGATSTDSMAIEPAWAYLSVDITSIGAGTKLEILYAS